VRKSSAFWCVYEKHNWIFKYLSDILILAREAVGLINLKWLDTASYLNFKNKALGTKRQSF